MWNLLNRCCHQRALGAHQVLNASSDHQRLRHRTQRWKGELLASIANGAGREIDFDDVAGDDGLLLAADGVGIFLAKPVDQFGRLDAKETVVESIAQVGLREAAGDYKRNACTLQ